METKQWANVDKTGWGDGPWQRGPDKIQWQDKATGYPCLIVRGPSGALCGYVGTHVRHPAYGKHYNDVDVEVHGGLTFSDFCREGKDESVGICHVAPGEDKVWWLGFDCAHYNDVSPKYNSEFRGVTFGSGSYKNLRYVRKEVTDLAKQLHAMEVAGFRQTWLRVRNTVLVPYVAARDSRGMRNVKRRYWFARMWWTSKSLAKHLEKLKAERG